MVCGLQANDITAALWKECREREWKGGTRKLFQESESQVYMRVGTAELLRRGKVHILYGRESYSLIKLQCFHYVFIITIYTYK